LVLLLLIAGTAAAVFFFTQNKRSAAVPAVPTPVPVAAETPAPSEATTAAIPANEEPGTAAVGQSPAATGAAAPAGSSAKAGGFADLFANGAKRANTDTTATFDANAAKAALDARLGIAARCREVGGPLGITRVNVTFALDGTVSSATISDAPFAGTTVGACICEAFKKARVKPFSGLPGQVSQRISIQ
jgi:hypothetical protein